MSDTRLIERWLPIAEIGEESLRERTPMTPFPADPIAYMFGGRAVHSLPRVQQFSPPCYLQTPITTSSSTCSESTAIQLPANGKLIRRVVRVCDLKATLTVTNERLNTCPSEDDREWIRRAARLNDLSNVIVLDPTAGGGSIPFESARLGLSSYGNDLNPVAALIEQATVEWPARLGDGLIREFRTLADNFLAIREKRLEPLFPAEPEHQSHYDQLHLGTNYPLPIL